MIVSSIFVGIMIITLVILLHFNPRRSKYPPGPWNLPILGYLHKIDPISPYITFSKLSQRYGRVYSVQLGLQNVVVISDPKMLKKVLAKDETVGRPPPYSTKELVKNEGDGVPINPTHLINQYITSVGGTMLIGKPFSDDDKSRTILVQNLHHVAKQGALAGPLNFLPFLRFLPQFRKTVASIKEAVDKVRQIQSKLITECQKSISNRIVDSPSNLVEACLLQRSENDVENDYKLEQLHHLLYDLFAGFTETTTTSLQWILLYLAQYEEVQDKIRQELFDVLKDKVPEMNDFQRLPYTKAVIAEINRIRTIVPLGFVHYTSTDINVDDFIIPKGTVIMPLLWTIHMDPELWTNPEEFCPERFLNDKGEFCQSENLLPFLTGKRMCVGEEMAKMMVHLFVATVVQKCKIKRPSGATLDFLGVCGLTLAPKPQELIFSKI